MIIIGIIIGFFLGAVTVAVIGVCALLWSHKDCGKDWWGNEE